MVEVNLFTNDPIIIYVIYLPWLGLNLENRVSRHSTDISSIKRTLKILETIFLRIL